MHLLVSPEDKTSKSQYRVIPSKNGKRVFWGVLEVGETSKGPRPKKFRVRRDGSDETRDPSEFVDLARMADSIYLPVDADSEKKSEMRELLSAYQLEAGVINICRLCLLENRFTPIAKQNKVKHDDEYVCISCAKQELRREISYKGDLSRKARDRLEDLLVKVGDVEKLVGLLNASLDPELTKFDEISKNVDDYDEISVDGLGLQDEFRSVLGFDTLLPVQALSVENGLLEGEDQLVVSATATGKTLIGELAGIENVLEGKGKTLFLVPLVALANQKHEKFKEKYSDIADVTIRVGSNRIFGSGDRFDPEADIVVGTYEGIDHALRTGKSLGEIGTVVIDEVHNLEDEDRGHRLDGLITRLKNYTQGETQWVYLSATVGNSEELAGWLDAELIEYEERPVPIERHLTFCEGHDKSGIIDSLVKREFNKKSSKGYRGQTIIFTNSRRRCHEIAGSLEYDASPYHAGLSYRERKETERSFAEADIAAVVTTAALGAGVDFPASQVIFESLAMGIEWLTVQEFEQMLGRAGRPDYHDRGVVYLLAEPDGVYHSSMERTEDEVALDLLKGEMEGVGVDYDEDAALEQTLANVAAGGSEYRRLNDALLGDVNTNWAVERLRKSTLMRDDEITRLGYVAAAHFMSVKEVETILDGIDRDGSPYEIVADLEIGEDGL